MPKIGFGLIFMSQGTDGRGKVRYRSALLLKPNLLSPAIVPRRRILNLEIKPTEIEAALCRNVSNFVETRWH